MAVSTNSPSKSIISPNNKTQKKMKKKEKKKPDSAQPPPSPLCSSPSKRRKSPGVRVVGGRIYDSENGKTCHQCRQKTMDFVASCKNQRQRDNKPCTFNFCHKCLFNRYGEKAEEMAQLDDWKCPKCRGICNCSFCMKKKGHQPTGILVHTAKAIGFSSVSEMLIVEGPKNLSYEKVVKDVGASPKKPTTSSKEPTVSSPSKLRNENSFVGKSDSNSQLKPSTSNGNGKKIGERKRKKFGQNDSNDSVREGSKEDQAQSEKKSSKKSQFSKEITSNPIRKEEETIDGRCDGAISAMKSSKKSRISKEITPNPIMKEEEKIGKRADGGLLEKMNSQERVSKEIFLEPIKEEEKVGERDSSLPACEETKVPNSGSTGNNGAKPKLRPAFHKLKKNAMRIQGTDSDADIPLPQGIDLRTVAGIDFPAEDVGHALQFLEFCKAFGQVFKLKKGQPESVLQELMRRCSRHRHGQYSSVVRFHIQLLSLIQKDLGEESPPLSSRRSRNSWLQALGKCISKSHSALKELPSNFFDRADDEYEMLDPSKKLRLLNFLCDETLDTADLRSWIDEQNSKFAEKAKEAKEKVLAARDKEKCVKQKMQDKVAKAILLKNGAPLSISEHDDLISKIKIEAAKAHAKTLEAIDMVAKKKQRSDAVRTEPILLDGNAHTFWRLRAYSGEPNILLQDIGSWDSVKPKEKWFTYDVEQKEVVENYISSLRRKGLRMQIDTLALGSSEASIKHETSDDPSSPISVIEES